MVGPGFICVKCFEDSTLSEYILHNDDEEFICRKCKNEKHLDEMEQ